MGSWLTFLLIYIGFVVEISIFRVGSELAGREWVMEQKGWVCLAAGVVKVGRERRKQLKHRQTFPGNLNSILVVTFC